MNKFDKRHLANVRKYQRQIDQIYRDAAAQVAARYSGLPVPDDAIFSFDDYPAIKAQIDALIRQMAGDIELTVQDGVRTEWNLSNEKNDALVDSIFGENAVAARYKHRNVDAMDAFLNRKTNGLGLSDRVWNYTNQFKGEIEMGLDVGIREGLDAASMARQLQQYLVHPDMLFRRVRDEHGILRLSQRAAQYHPGQGVYRSSYKNARRLAATETNIAYRTADHEQWKQFDFVVGIRIELSNNHTCLNAKGKPMPFYDICDELQGKYPKEFKFVGWHPHCRCIATAITKTDAESDEDFRRALRGEAKSDTKDSENYVGEMPDNFKQWMEDNAERIAGHKTQPYFIRDNVALIDGNVMPTKIITPADEPRQLTALEIAEQRHAARTAEQRDAIIEQWQTRQMLNLMDDLNAGLLPQASQGAIDVIKDSIALGDYDDARRRISLLQAASRRHAARTLDDIRRIQDMADVRRYGQEYVDNVHKIENQLGIKRGKRMAIDEADMQSANPFYSQGREYHINCATCTPTYVLRTMGFDVTAGANVVGTQVNYLSKGNAWEVWLNADGSAAVHESAVDWLASKNGKMMTQKRWLEFIEEKTADEGIYGFSVGWKGGGGHMTVLQRTADGKLLYIEPQHDNHLTRENIAGLVRSAAGKQHRVRGIMRIDDKLFNTKFISILVKK